MKRKLNSLKARETKTTVDTWLNSMKLVMTGYSVRNTNCGDILLVQGTTFLTCALSVVMTLAKCCNSNILQMMEMIFGVYFVS